jgi:hypothetical protein
MIAEHLYIAYSRHCRRVMPDELPQGAVLGFGGIDNDVAIDEH